jgi:hypothetical protein
VASENVNIVHRLSAYGPNRDYRWPKPDKWASMDESARKQWAIGRLKQYNAQAIFVNVS